MKNPINFFDAEMIGNTLWFSNLNYNALMKTNLENGITEIVATFVDADPLDVNLHIRVIRNNDLLFFIPYSGRVVQVWNMEKNYFEDSIRLDCEENCKWVNAYIDEDNYIWMVPEELYRPFAVIDTKGRMARMEDVAKKLDAPNGFTTGMKCVEYCKNAIYIQGYKRNICFRFDCRSGNVQRYSFPEGCMVTALRSNGENGFYLQFYGKPDLYEWDLEKNSVSEYVLKLSVVKGRNAFWDMVKQGNKILLIPCHGDELMLYDQEVRCMNKLNLTDNFSRTTPYAMFGFFKKRESSVYLFPRACNRLVIVNMWDGAIRELSFVLEGKHEAYSEDMLKQVFEKWYKREMTEVFAYSDTMDLFLEKMISERKITEFNSESNVGEKIHRYIKEIIK